MFKYLIAICLIVQANFVYSDTLNPCLNIQSQHQRLACYDKQARINSAADTTDNHSLFGDEPMIQPYKASYILPLSYHNNNTSYEPGILFNTNREGVEVDNLELKFQLSFRLPFISDLLIKQDSVSLAYTQTSYWQLYNQKASKPFRENNYEPEIMWQLDLNPADKVLFNLPLEKFSVAFNHQSNGGSNHLSLGWNRIVFNWAFRQGPWQVAFQPWYRISGDEISNKIKKTDFYMGHFNLITRYKWGRHVFSSKLRNNLKFSQNRGYLELGWAFPLPSLNLKGFVQYNYGYGETLIDYNQKISRASLGILLADWG